MRIERTTLRLSEDLKDWLETRSTRNYRSLNSEIIAILTAVKQGEESGDGFERFANPSGLTDAHIAALDAGAK